MLPCLAYCSSQLLPPLLRLAADEGQLFNMAPTDANVA
jgi:hypothetical protein